MGPGALYYLDLSNYPMASIEVHGQNGASLELLKGLRDPGGLAVDTDYVYV